jgi:hypothetical protein
LGTWLHVCDAGRDFQFNFGLSASVWRFLWRGVVSFLVDLDRLKVFEAKFSWFECFWIKKVDVIRKLCRFGFFFIKSEWIYWI